MLSASLLSIAALTVPSVLAASLRDQLPGVPAGWSVSGTPDASQSITLKLAVKQQNIDQLEGLLRSVRKARVQIVQAKSHQMAF